MDLAFLFLNSDGLFCLCCDKGRVSAYCQLCSVVPEGALLSVNSLDRAAESQSGPVKNVSGPRSSSTVTASSHGQKLTGLQGQECPFVLLLWPGGTVASAFSPALLAHLAVELSQ